MVRLLKLDRTAYEFAKAFARHYLEVPETKAPWMVLTDALLRVDRITGPQLEHLLSDHMDRHRPTEETTWST